MQDRNLARKPGCFCHSSHIPGVVREFGATSNHSSIAARRDWIAFRCALALTDGITEVRHEGAFLEYEGMVELARAGAATETMDEMGTAILEGARAFGNGRFSDDVCLLLARLS